MSKTVSIVVPCFNEAESIQAFYSNTVDVLNRINVEYEICFVDDGSTDDTIDIIKELSGNDQNVTYLSFSRNFGKEAAMYAGLNNAKGDYVGIMDADLQDPPELLPQMLTILESGEYDCVATRRNTRTGESVIKSLFAKLFYKIINLFAEVKIIDGARDFRLMNRSMVTAVNSLSEYNRFSKGLFEWVGFKTYWISYDNNKRIAGETKWNFWKLFRYAIDGIINYSHIPLSVVSGLGIIMTIVAFIAMIIVIIRKLVCGDPVAGWASTICIIIFIGGIQLLCIGIIGQYIAKTYMETKNRPHYIVKDTNIDGAESIK